jgi:hypothetical protein
MKKLLLIFILLVIFVSPAPAETEKPVRRIALLVGANQGGESRTPLRYAVADARSMLLLLEALGGVQSEDSQLLVQPDRETFLWELNRFAMRLKNAHDGNCRVEAVFYFSGHADEFSLLLGQDKVGYPELRQELAALPADLRICIFDACASGAFIRDKGGIKKAPLIMSAADNMSGLAVLTSSSADEVSQESEHIKGSFFTHALISGLRGAADQDRDGRITLGETYQFSFNQTLNQTQKTAWGPQHPNYKIQLSGTGDVVLTSLAAGNAWLRLPENLAGNVYIHDRTDRLLAEFPKTLGQALDVTLDVGDYRLLVINDNNILEGKVNLKKGETRLLELEELSVSTPMDTVARGDRQLSSGQRLIPVKPLILSTRMNFQTAFLSSETALMPGLELGLLTNRGISFGITVYARLSQAKSSKGMPAYFGLFGDYQISLGRQWICWGGGLLGLGYREAKSSQSKDSTTPALLIFEPRLGILRQVNRFLQLGLHTGLNYVGRLGNPAWTLGLEMRFSVRPTD